MSWINNSDSIDQTLENINTPQPLINPDIVGRYRLICYGIISEGITVFGIATNVINIICFVKQGFKESTNISLLSLAISDLGSLLFVLWTNIAYVPQFQDLDIPFHAMDTMYLISGYPRTIFTRITAVVTAFITLERCLCITMPLKVSSMFTAQRIAIINACIFFALFLTAIPVYISAKLTMVYYEELNKTVLGLRFTKDRTTTEQISFTINSVIVPVSALMIVIVCMVTMVTTLKKQSKWRQTQQATKGPASSSERDQRLVKMIIMISILFVVCFAPSAVLFLCITLEPELNYGGKYISITLIVYGICNIAETINSSMNIFIYYKMSTKYRTQLRQLLFSERGNHIK